jgi:hypothetical protein
MGGKTRGGEEKGRGGREGEGKEREDMGGEGKDYGRGKLRHDSWDGLTPLSKGQVLLKNIAFYVYTSR